jgi:hypothetical protein
MKLFTVNFLRPDLFKVVYASLKLFRVRTYFAYPIVIRVKAILFYVRSWSWHFLKMPHCRLRRVPRHFVEKHLAE